MKSYIPFTASCLFWMASGCGDHHLIDDVASPERVVSPPQFTARQATRTPPALSGGTLIILADDRTAVASDPDHDVVWLADTLGGTQGRSVALRAGDEPGRLAADGAGHVFVALRRGGAVVTIDPARAVVTARRAVCPAPRGLAWNADTARLIVACEGGELVTLPAEGEAVERRTLGADLRDVSVANGRVYVTHFRTGVLERVEEGDTATVVSTPTQFARLRSTAWHSYATGGEIVTLAQAIQPVSLGVSNTPPSLNSGRSGGGYGELTPTRPPPVMPHLTVVATDGERGFEAAFPMGGLAVDVAVRTSDRERHVALVSPGWAYGQGVAQVREWRISTSITQRMVTPDVPSRVIDVPGQAVAAAYTGSGWLVVQTRAPGTLVVGGRTIPLYRDAVADVGHDVFHATTPSGLACASCHPEGGDDSRTWNFEVLGRRRTPSLRGGIMGTAPFHWDGDMRDIGHLTSAVFGARMGAGPVAAQHGAALGRWVQSIPNVPRAAGPADAVARGEALFRSADVGCASCHSGSKFTNNLTMDVGTGAAFQVPPLVGLATRGPYMHNGCADTLFSRFTDRSCGGGDTHGRTSQLSATQVTDLVAYLQSL